MLLSEIPTSTEPTVQQAGSTELKIDDLPSVDSAPTSNQIAPEEPITRIAVTTETPVLKPVVVDPQPVAQEVALEPKPDPNEPTIKIAIAPEKSDPEPVILDNPPSVDPPIVGELKKDPEVVTKDPFIVPEEPIVTTQDMVKRVLTDEPTPDNPPVAVAGNPEIVDEVVLSDPLDPQIYYNTLNPEDPPNILEDKLELQMSGNTTGGLVELFPGIAAVGNSIVTSAEAKGFTIGAVSKKNINKVSEIAIFEVDDISGKVNGIERNKSGYLQAVFSKAKSILTSLNGDFFSQEKREIAVEPNKTYELVEIEDSSISEVKQQLATDRLEATIHFTRTDDSPIQIAIDSARDGYTVSIDNDDLVLQITKLDGATPTQPMGSKSQHLAQGRTIDLTDYADRTLSMRIETKGESKHTNQVGFYVVEDDLGTIKTASGGFVKPGDPTYAAEAINNAIANAGLHANNNETKADGTIAGGKIYAPVLVSQGNFNDFLQNNPLNSGEGNSVHAYFNYIGANSDKVDHFRLLGANTFAVEDMYGGGDKDYNDLIVKLQIDSVTM